MFPFNFCVSISVLNVINNKEERMNHLKLCGSVLKDCGKLYIKIWEGNKTGISTYLNGSYQNNLLFNYYIDEIKEVFGRNIFIDFRNKIIKCIKILP
jgi:hypothetical protein